MCTLPKEPFCSLEFSVILIGEMKNNGQPHPTIYTLPYTPYTLPYTMRTISVVFYLGLGGNIPRGWVHQDWFLIHKYLPCTNCLTRIMNTFEYEGKSTFLE